jgi:pimeloyl-ACP methyl ester carboxylesterase
MPANTADTMPPRRSTHTFGPPAEQWVYDRWGDTGRPVVLLHSLLFDRRVWWPVAADLAAHCVVIAPDLPGHGDTAARAELAPAHLAGVLADLVHSLGLRRAPVVVGHGTSAQIATAFAASYAIHTLVTADEMDPCHVTTAEQLLAAIRPQEVPAVYRPYALAPPDIALFSAYRTANLGVEHPPAPADIPHVLVSSGSPGPCAADREAGERRYPAAARLPQLSDPYRFAADLRALL